MTATEWETYVYSDGVTPLEAATRRANETGRRQLISGMGHVWMDCACNRRLGDECGGIALVVKPKKATQ